MKDMTMAELGDTSGGVPAIFVALGGVLLGVIAEGWSDFKKGFQEAYWHQQNLAQ